jgi:phosphoribosylamine--glycine ligase
MLTDEGPKVVEFNCRFGDPEAQVVLPLIDDDLAGIMMSIAEGKLASSRIRQHEATAVCVVMASNGYPDEYQAGKVILGLDAIDPASDGVVVFHAGTRQEGSRIVTAGGRVLGVTALGRAEDLHGTILAAYGAVEKIRFDGAYFRTDIGRKGLAARY